jgi:DNA-binding CsgD family transcriptional regulator
MALKIILRIKYQEKESMSLPGKLLSVREDQVAQLILRGLMKKEIAPRLKITEKTVEKHIEAVYYKFGVTSRTAFLRVALRSCYCTLEEFTLHTDGELAVKSRPCHLMPRVNHLSETKNPATV